MSKIVEAVLLPSGTNVEPEPILIDDYLSIQKIIGGPFDCVRTDLGYTDKVALVGYVHDEGLLIDLEYNYLATALFKREIRGPVVVAWGLSENGYYDGDNHDMPKFINEFLMNDLLMNVALAYNMSVTMDLAIKEIIEAGYPDPVALRMAVDYVEQNTTVNRETAIAINNAMKWGAENVDNTVVSEFCQTILDVDMFTYREEE